MCLNNVWRHHKYLFMQKFLYKNFIQKFFSVVKQTINSKLAVFMKVKVKSLSRVRLFATPWTVVYQAPPSMGFSRQECRRGLPFPSPGDLPNPEIELGSPALLADALPSEPPGKPCI